MSEQPTSEPRSGTPARTGTRRPLPPIRVHRTLPPGAVPRQRPGQPEPAPTTTAGPGAGPGGGTGPGSPRPGGATLAAGARPARVWVPVAAGAVVVALLAGWLVTRGGSDGEGSTAPRTTAAAGPPALRLGDRPAPAPRETPQAPADLRLATEPPPGPERGAVQDYPAAKAAARTEVVRLATALGLGGEPVRDGAGWTVHDGMATVRVHDVSGTPWELTADADRPPDLAPGVRPRPPGNLAVRAQAEGVLGRIGGTYGPLRQSDARGYADVLAAPTVDRLPTAGLETRLRFDPDLRLVAASGWLAHPAAGATYPLLQARAALEAAPGSTSCPPSCGEASAATPGLALRWHADGRAVLVPAWLFEVRGGDVPLTTLAVAPAYLTGPEPAPGDSMPIPLPTR